MTTQTNIATTPVVAVPGAVQPGLLNSTTEAIRIAPRMSSKRDQPRPPERATALCNAGASPAADSRRERRRESPSSDPPRQRCPSRSSKKRRGRRENEQQQRPRQKVTEPARNIHEPSAEFEVLTREPARELPRPDMRHVAIAHREQTWDRPRGENADHEEKAKTCAMFAESPAIRRVGRGPTNTTA